MRIRFPRIRKLEKVFTIKGYHVAVYRYWPGRVRGQVIVPRLSVKIKDPRPNGVDFHIKSRWIKRGFLFPKLSKRLDVYVKRKKKGLHDYVEHDIFDEKGRVDHIGIELFNGVLSEWEFHERSYGKSLRRLRKKRR